jgi:hypothetical protein
LGRQLGAGQGQYLHGAPLRLSHAFDGVDQTVRRSIVGINPGISLKFRPDGFGELLAKLYAHLVEGVDVPDGALGEDLVFVEGDERSQDRRRQFRVDKRD